MSHLFKIPSFLKQPFINQSYLWRIIYSLIGFLLLTSATLKALGNQNTWTNHLIFIFDPFIQIVGIAWEYLLGGILVFFVLTSAERSAYVWLATLITFIIFAALSGYLGMIGQAECGCFGSLSLNPWATCAIDGLIICSLIICRPDIQSFFTPKANISPSLCTDFAHTLLGGFVLFGLTAGFSTIVFGNFQYAFAFLLNEPVFAPKYVVVGTVQAGEILEKEIVIVNRTNGTVKFIGGTTNCFCSTTKAMPFIIDPGKTARIPFKIKIPFATSGFFSQSVELWTDCPQAKTLKVQIGGRIKV